MAELSGRLWPIHPHRFKDELLSFWLLRLAHGNGLKLQTFTNLAFGRNASVWNRDIDRCATDTFLSDLSLQTGASVEEIKGGMLSAYEGVLFGHANARGNTPWILPLGIYHRKRRDFGMQFCPLCLFEDSVPYFRRHWRLALTTICERHGTLLHDRCWQCGAPVAWFRTDLGHRSGYKLDAHTICPECGFDYRRAPAFDAPAVNGQSLLALRSIICFHDFGWWFCGDKTIHYSPLFFDVLRHLVTWLAANCRAKIREAIRVETGWLREMKQHVIFEFRPLMERHLLLAASVWLIQDWPDRFIRICKAAGVTRAHVLLGIPHPFWFEDGITEQLSAAHYILNDVETSCAAQFLREHEIKTTARNIGAIVGSSNDAQAVARYAKRRQGPLSDELFWEAMSNLQTRICRLPKNSQRKAILQRDRVMFVVQRLSGRSSLEIRAMTVAAIKVVTCDRKIELKGRRRIATYVHTYLQSARPRLMKGRLGEILFPSVKTGGQICAHEWGNRWLAMKRFIGGPCIL